MDNMFVWILIFAGAAITLLGVFLVASERELKNKRVEIEQLIAKLGDPAAANAGAPAPAVTEAEVAAAGAAHLQNQELQAEISSLAGKLASSQKNIDDLQSAQQGMESTKSEAQQLRAANVQLQAEITALRELLKASEERVSHSANQDQDTAESRSRLQSEAAELRQKLAAAEAKVRELEGTKQQLADVEARAAHERERQNQLETRIADLEKELAAGQEQRRELERMRDGLADTERLHQELRSENQRYRQEISRYQERLAESEKSRSRLAGLRQHYAALLAKQSSLKERQSEFQDELVIFAQLMETSVHDAGRTNSAEESPSVAPSGTETRSGDSRHPPEQGADRGQQHDAMTNLGGDSHQDSSRRETQLVELLAAIRQHGAKCYEGRIDAIKDMAGLTGYERRTARDIFLLRADDAQKLGRDDEMLRYRAWARNVNYRTPFGTRNIEADASGKADSALSGVTVTRDADDQNTQTAAIGGKNIILAVKPTKKRKRRFGIFSLVVVLGAAGALAAGL